MIQIAILLVILSIVTILSVFGYIIGTKYIDVKYSNRPSEKIELTASQLLIKNIDAHLKMRELFLTEIKTIVANELNKKIIVDKMANSHSISTEELFSQIDDIVEKIYAVFPVTFMEIVFELYTPEQIKLIVTEEVSDFSRSYYKVFDSRRRG